MPAFMRIRITETGWEGPLHIADARELLASGAGVKVDGPASGQAQEKAIPGPVPPAKTGRKAKARPIEPPLEDATGALDLGAGESVSDES